MLKKVNIVRPALLHLSVAMFLCLCLLVWGCSKTVSGPTPTPTPPGACDVEGKPPCADLACASQYAQNFSKAKCQCCGGPGPSKDYVLLSKYMDVNNNACKPDERGHSNMCIWASVNDLKDPDASYSKTLTVCFESNVPSGWTGGRTGWNVSICPDPDAGPNNHNTKVITKQ